MDDYVKKFGAIGGLTSGTKLYYREYPFKVLLKKPPKGGEAIVDAAIKAAAAMNTKHSVTRSASTISVYFKDADDAYVYALNQKDTLLSVTGPENKSQLDAIVGDGDVITPIIRDPFWRRYAYKVVISGEDSRDIEETVQSLLNSLDDHLYEAGPSRVLYLNDLDSVVLTQILLGQHVKHIFKTISKDQIDENGNLAGS